MSYLTLTLLFLVPPVAVTGVCAWLVRPARTWWLALAVTVATMVGLTAVFDSVMVAADLFRYDEERLAGFRVWLTPVEDLGWPVAAALALPALWELLGRRTDERGGIR